MDREIRTICYDETLRIEAYRLEGVVQAFPNHFHEHYVFGLLERGARSMTCQNRDYTLRSGDVVLFHPGDSHACAQLGIEDLDYRGLNLPAEVVLELAEEKAGEHILPCFSSPVVQDDGIAGCFRALHQAVMDGGAAFEREEMLLLLVTLLTDRCSKLHEPRLSAGSAELERACVFMRRHYSEHISLAQICRYAGLSKSALLRAFTKYRGITPYRYLQTLRINKAKKLLEQGLTPVQAALQTGFSDQSHFTNFFSMFIGVAPGVYRSIFWDKETPRTEREKGSGDEA